MKKPLRKEKTLILDLKEIMSNFNPLLYKLVGHKPVQCKNFVEWAKEHEKAAKMTGPKPGGLRVGWDKVGRTEVSTVFLGVDHSWQNKQLLFETMVFGGKLRGLQQRYRTWKAAERGHQEIVAQVKAAKRK